jgi:hypothetical protein
MGYINKKSEEWSKDKGWSGPSNVGGIKHSNFIFPVVVITIVAIILLGIR